MSVNRMLMQSLCRSPRDAREATVFAAQASIIKPIAMDARLLFVYTSLVDVIYKPRGRALPLLACRKFHEGGGVSPVRCGVREVRFPQ